MIFYWLRLAWLKLVWLVTPPKARDVVRIDRNTPCPVCAARDGELMCVTPKEGVMVRHTCHECGARWHEPAVTKVGTDVVWASDKSEYRAVISRSGSAA